MAINTAHELGHKRDPLERWLSKIALAQSGYGHFFVEHNRGHHVRVATPEDPASARLGESFWAVIPRTVKGSVVSACELEREWLARDGRAWWTIRDDVPNVWAMTIVLFAGLTVEQTIAEHPDDPLAALTTGLERFLTIATTDPFVRLLLGDEGTGGLLPLVTTQSRPVLDWASERVAATIRAQWPQAASVDLDSLADTLVRLAISHVTAPRDAPDRTAAAITRLLAPSIERMLEASIRN